MSVEIISDGRTVWVNSAAGMCVGRYKPGIMDVHHDAEGQLAGKHCLDCGTGNEATWEAFKGSMYEHHGVEVPEHHRPIARAREAGIEVVEVGR